MMDRPDLKGMCPYLEVFDMPASLQFYRDILGFTVTKSSGQGDDVDWVLLRLDQMELMLNTAYEKENRPPQPDENRTPGHRDVAIFFGCPDPEAMYAYLKSRGITLNPPMVTGYGFRAISLQDPDGYGLWFHWPAQK